MVQDDSDLPLRGVGLVMGLTIGIMWIAILSEDILLRNSQTAILGLIVGLCVGGLIEGLYEVARRQEQIEAEET